MCLSISLSHAQLPQDHAAEWLSKTIIPIRMMEDESGKILLEDGHKTYSYDGLSFQSSKNSIPPNLILEKYLAENPGLQLPGKPIAILPIDENSNWLSIENKGIFLIKDGVLRQVHFPNGNVGKQVIELKKYNDQIFICTSNKGLFKWDPIAYDLQAVYLHPGFNKSIYDVVKDHWGNLWIASEDGLLLKRDINWNSQLPELRIDSIKLVYENRQTKELSLDSSATIYLNPKENHLQFFFSATQLILSDKLQFRVRMGPIQNSWVIPTTNDMVSFSNLQSGEYQFEVKAFVNDRYAAYVTSPKIIIEKPKPYQLWYYVIGGLLLIGGIWFIAYRRSQQFIKKLKQDKEKLLTEKTILQFQHKALQLQMNPHFVFNSFNSIQGLIAEDRNRDASKYLNKFAQLMRGILKNSTSDWVELSDEISILRSYLEIEQLCRNDSFDYQFYFEKDLENEDLLIPPMIIQPFLENAIIHGFKKLERKGTLEVRFSFADNSLKCQIIDNGIGLSHSKKNQNIGYESFGIDLIKQRLQKLTHKDDPVQISEMKKPDGTSDGTKVILYLPYK